MIIIDQISNFPYGPNSTIAMPLTIASQECVLLVLFQYDSNAAVTSVTFNNQSLTAIGRSTNGTLASSNAYILFNPPVGTYTLQVVAPNANGLQVAAMSLLGVSKRTSNVLFATNTGTAISSFSINLNVASANSMLFSVVDTVNGGAVPVETPINNVVSFKYANPGLQKMSWTTGANDTWTGVVVALEPDDAPSIWYPNASPRNSLDSTLGQNISFPSGVQNTFGYHPSSFFKNSFLHTVGRTVLSPSTTVTTTKTQTGKARVTATSTQTITGKGRIQTTSTQTQTGKASIVKQTTVVGGFYNPSIVTSPAIKGGTASSAQTGQANGQSFSLASPIVSSGVNLNLKKVGNPVDTLHVDIVTSLTGSPIASGTISGSNLTTSNAVYSILFSSNVNLAASTTYYIRCTRSPDTNDTTNYYIMGAAGTGGTFTQGALQFRDNNAWAQDSGDDCYFGLLEVPVTTQTQTGKARITASTTQTIQGKADIQRTTTQTQTGKARIQLVTTQTQTGKSRVTASTTKTQLGKANIASGNVTTTQTQPGKARITVSTTQTQTGKARMQQVVNQTQTGKARVTVSTTQTQTGKARIQATVTQTQQGKSRIQLITTKTQTGKATIASGIKLQVPIELLDVALASTTGATIWEQTKTNLDTGDYDGNPTYEFEIVANNFTTSTTQTVILVDNTGSALATITLSAGAVGTDSSKRYRTSFTPTNGASYYRVKTGATTAADDVEVYTARIIVTQNTTLTKTRVQIPLANHAGDLPGASTTSTIDNSTSSTFGQPTIDNYGIFLLTLSKYVTIAGTNPYSLEVSLKTDGASTIKAAIFDKTTNTEVASSELSLNSTTQTNLVANWSSDTNWIDGHEYELRIARTSGTGTVNLDKAALYIRVTNVTVADIYWRIGKRIQSTSSFDNPYQRVLYDSTKYLNPTTDWEVTARQATAGTNNVELIDSSTQDQGVSGASHVSTVTLSSSTKSRQRNTGISLTSGDRFYDKVNVTSGEADLALSVIIVHATNAITTTQKITGKARLTATTTKNQQGKARITATSTQTQQGKARIQLITNQTQTGKARITASTTQTQQGKANIRNTTSQTQAGKARIQQVVTQTQTGKGRVTAATTQTITGLARINSANVTTTKTQLGKARITVTSTQTQTGKARVTISTSQTQLGKARITNTTTQTTAGKARVTASTTQAQQGKSRITATTSQTQQGKARVTASTNQTQQGKARIQKIVTQTIQGISRIQVVTNKTQTGKARITASTTQTQPGKARVTVSTLQTILGKGSISKTAIQTITGKGRVQATSTQTQTGKANIIAPKIYTRGANAVLPTDNADLSTAYSGSDYTNVQTQDGSRINIAGAGYLEHEFKDYSALGVVPFQVKWVGQTTKPTSSVNLLLQVYNFNSAAWETLATDSATAANTDITLQGTVSVNVANYYDSNNKINCRVYQGVD